jgi:hypothetical protein
MWLYSGNLFDTNTAAQPVLDLCAREGINRLYLGAYAVWQNGTAAQKANLRHFLSTAQASGIRVEALAGDTDWQDRPDNVRLKLDQILALHKATPADGTDDFDAIHYDVEFWTHSLWTSAPDEAARRQIAINYLDNVLANARSHLDASGAGGVGLSVDLSAHLDNADRLPTPFLYNGVTQPFVGHVFDLVDDVVIMSYIDYANGLYNWTQFELNVAAAKGRTIQLGAHIEAVPPANPINSFADNAPSGYAAMTSVLEQFHEMLTPEQLAALDGFAVFQYVGYKAAVPNPRNRADLDGDRDVDPADYAKLAGYLAGPLSPAGGLARDADLDGDGFVTLADFAVFTRCFTGANTTVPEGCAR